MSSRLDLHNKLIELLGSKNVYYQPPANMSYPAIRYSTNDIEIEKADDSAYLWNIQYQITVISKTPDHPVINKLLELPMCSFDRHYVSDNLNHDVLTLYY